MAIKEYSEMTDSEKFSANAHAEQILKIAAAIKADREKRGLPPLKWADDGE